MYQGFLNVFDKAESAFVGAYRSPMESDNSFDIVQGYTVTPDLTGKVLIMIDPMLATGKSVVSVYDSLLFHGKPKSVHLVSIIASKPGVSYLQKRLPEAHIWTGAIDEELNQKSYIVPGLGDAGDLAFGVKEDA
jgi:uracil phosphoribosyltransferase